REIRGEGLAVGGFDLGPVDEIGERVGDRAVALRRRRPGDLRDLAARAGNGLAERGEPDIEDLQFFLEQLDHRSAPAAIRIASRTASALLDASVSPASRSFFSCADRFCGSRSVPQMKPTKAGFDPAPTLNPPSSCTMSSSAPDRIPPDREAIRSRARHRAG